MWTEKDLLISKEHKEHFKLFTEVADRVINSELARESRQRRGEMGATYETEVHKLVNTERRKAGLAELQYDDALAEIAEKHSIDMSPAGRHFYDDEDRVNLIYRDYTYPNHHTNPDGLRVYDRYRKAGYSGCIAYGENILYYSNSNLAKMSKQEIAQKIMYGTHGWWNSPSHRANILSSKFNREGLGIYAYGDTVWATQNFSKK